MRDKKHLQLLVTEEEKKRKGCVFVACKQGLVRKRRLVNVMYVSRIIVASENC